MVRTLLGNVVLSFQIYFNITFVKKSKFNTNILFSKTTNNYKISNVNLKFPTAHLRMSNKGCTLVLPVGLAKSGNPCANIHVTVHFIFSVSILLPFLFKFYLSLVYVML